MTAPITALILTKNEAAGIARCVEAAKLCCDQIVVVDSNSTDGTAEIAADHGAEVVNFVWNGKYPKKKQWAMELPIVRNDWVLHLDADEIVTTELAEEVGSVTSAVGPVAYEVELAYRFVGKTLKHGHAVFKRSLLNRRQCTFPTVDDLDAPGGTEVEGHYQPTALGQVTRLNSKLLHDDPDPISTWIARHNKYSDWEAHLRTRPAARTAVREHKSAQGRAFDQLPFKPLLFFFYCYIVRRGFADGRAGLTYAIALAWYYWLIDVKVRELRRGMTPSTESVPAPRKLGSRAI